MKIIAPKLFPAVLAIISTVASVGCDSASSAVENETGERAVVSPREPTTEFVADEVNAEPAIIASNLTARSASEGKTLFTKLEPSATGVDFQNSLVADHPMSRLYHSGFVCGGVALGDFDGDDLPDLFFVSGPGKNKLYRQSGKGGVLKFTDITAEAAVDGGNNWGTGATVVDLDADGDLDIYVCNYDSPNELFLNDGKGKFREAAAEFGLALVDASLMPTFCDYDRDGDLDVFVLTNRYYREGGRPKEPPFEKTADGKVVVKPEFAKYYSLKQNGPNAYDMDEFGRPDYLLRNDGGKFIDVSVAAGIRKEGFGLSATWWDFDNDGFMDIYVANDFADPDNLFRNNGDGTFTDVITRVLNYTPWFSMGADAGDVNNDGLLDFIALDMAATTHYKSKMAMGEMGSLQWIIEKNVPRQVMRNCLYLNTGTGRFQESAGLSGVASSDWSWAAKLADFDNDGRVDLFISNGMARDFNNSDIVFTKADQVGKSEWDHYKDSPPKKEQNLAFRNEGKLEFSKVSKAWGLDHVGMSYGSAYGDLDRDGDLDLVVVNLDEPVSIYRNGLKSSQASSVTVELRGLGSNRQGLGALVTAEAGGTKHVRQMVPMSGYLSNNLAELHFGFGKNTIIDKLTVRWPEGGIQAFENLKTDRHYTITQPEAELPAFAQTRTRPIYRYFSGLRGIVHKERRYEDFVRQPLLPNKLSQLGPGIAFADVDANGTDDFFIGCPRGQSGAIFLNDGKGKFSVAANSIFEEDEDREDMGVLFFDADSDGDSDLYVASGSYEYDKGDALVRDRLYLNDGKGKFSRAPEGSLPDLRDNSSCVVAADYDRDGDLDLFVGGRVVTGEYPVAAASRLLINESAGGKVKFVEASSDIAPGLREAGLVTGALWTDVDGDGWIDLMVTLEWGPVKLFRNKSGRLTDTTEAAGLSRWSGWWNSITGADVDNDGDIDYAVGNAGLNTKYHADADHPVFIYYGDYANDGTKRIVEAKFEGSTLVPGRGRSCSTRAMPHLGEKFKTYHAFAKSALPEIYPQEVLSGAEKFEANTLESGLLINDGSGKFTFKPLPNEAQTSPIFGLEFVDFDADGNLDLYAVQNFSTPQFETPPFRGGLSILLEGDGKGSFLPVPPNESGLVVSSDGRGLAKTDLNGDGRPDFVIAVNNGELLSFTNSDPNSRRPMRTLRLIGKPGNPLAAGARVTLKRSIKGASSRVAEIHQGAGYLSQSSSRIYIDDRVTSVTVKWPDGAQTEHNTEKSSAHLEIYAELDP